MAKPAAKTDVKPDASKIDAKKPAPKTDATKLGRPETKQAGTVVSTLTLAPKKAPRRVTLPDWNP